MSALVLLLFSDDLSQVCDIDEDSAYVAERVDKLTSAYEALQKALKEKLSLLELRHKSWEHFPVEQATQVRQRGAWRDTGCVHAWGAGWCTYCNTH